MSHLPESLKLPLFDPEQLAGLSADNGSVARRVVQDRLPKGCPNPQRADCDCILHTDMTTFSYCVSITESICYWANMLCSSIHYAATKQWNYTAVATSNVY